MSIRLAIIGAGTIGQVHALAAKEAGLEVASIVDADGNRAQSLAEQLTGVKHSADITTVWKDPSIDAVVVAVPNRWHGEYAMAAMEAGKDVLVEKPMALNEGECQRMNELAESAGRILQIGMANRWTGVGRAAKRVAASGDLGNIYHAKAILYGRRSVPGLGGWFTTKAISGGGVLVDNGVHLIDLAMWLMNFPQVTSVSGQIHSHFGKRMKDYVYESMWAGPPKLDGVCDVEDSAHALVRFAGGISLDVQVSWAMNIPKDMEGSLIGLFGDRGGVTFKLFGDHLDLATEEDRRNVDKRIGVEPINQFQAQIADFARCVQTREPPPVSGRQGQIVQSVLDAIYRSSQTNREVVFERT